MAKEAVQCELELNNAASNLTAVEGPFYQKFCIASNGYSVTRQAKILYTNASFGGGLKCVDRVSIATGLERHLFGHSSPPWGIDGLGRLAAVVGNPASCCASTALE